MDGMGNENPGSPKRANVIEKTPCDPWIILSHQLRFGPWVRPGLTYKENPVINLGFAWKKFQKYYPKNPGLMLISHGYKVNKYIKQIQETGKKQSPFPSPTISFTQKNLPAPTSCALMLWSWVANFDMAFFAWKTMAIIPSFHENIIPIRVDCLIG